MFVTLDKEWLEDIDCFIMPEDFKEACIPRSAVCVAVKDDEYVVVATNGVADALIDIGSGVVFTNGIPISVVIIGVTNMSPSVIVTNRGADVDVTNEGGDVANNAETGVLADNRVTSVVMTNEEKDFIVSNRGTSVLATNWGTAVVAINGEELVVVTNACEEKIISGINELIAMPLLPDILVLACGKDVVWTVESITSFAKLSPFPNVLFSELIVLDDSRTEKLLLGIFADFAFFITMLEDFE